jgi:serine/threonine protein kinase
VQQIFRERDILRLLSTPENSSPFIVTLYCTFQDQDSLYFVLTLAGKKDLLSRLKSLGGRFTIAQTQFVMAQLWSAIGM